MACAMAFPTPRIFCCLALKYAKTSLKTLSSTERNSLFFTWLIDVFPLVCSCQSRALKGDFLSPNHEVPCWFWNISSWNQQATAKSYRAVHEASWTYFDFFHQCHDQLTNDIFAKVSHNWSHWEQILPDGDALGNRSRQEYHFGGWNSCSLLDFYYSFLFLVQCILHSLKSTKSWFCDGVLYLAGHTRESGQKLMWKTLSESQQPNVVFFSGNLENSSPGCDKVILQERWIIVNEYWIRDWTRCNPWPCRANFSSFRLKHDVV